MASRLFAAAASSSSSSLARLISRRGLASPAGRRWTAEKVNLWEDPTSPMRWKDGHFVLASVSIWAGIMYIAFSFRGKEKYTKY
ncbi:hypothetical protein EJB05_31019, partial [Eragrostis curvula]